MIGSCGAAEKTLASAGGAIATSAGYVGEAFRRDGRKPGHMVDFQERDESRGLGNDEDDEDEAEDENASETREGEAASESDAEPADAESGETGAPADSDGGEETAASPEHEEHGDESGEPDHGHDEHEHDHGHDHHRHDVDQVGTAVVTVSSSRSIEADPAGDAIEAAMEPTGEVVTRELIRDDFDTVQGTVNSLTDRDDVDMIVTAGGTGVTPDDVTIEAVRPLFSKELPGFGELFRILSHDEIGTKVVATRATAGVVEGVPVFCMPGSENAVRLGTEEIIVPEAGHLAGLAARGLEEEEEEEEEE
ncbi:MAG: molybdenum cofactor biosynthesis protein B [Halobacteriales archaeon]|jgi:molybdenum cofactor biosynthesis protein B